MNNETLTKDYIVKLITQPLNFRRVDPHNWQQSKTLWKELTGVLTLKVLFPDLKWITDKTLQRAGVDFTYKGKNHDLKALVGDYHDENGLNIVLELSQYGKPSLTADKLTDVLVYTILEERGVHVVFINYKRLVQNQDRLKEYYNIRTSANGSGTYVKVPVKELSKITNVYCTEVKV